MRTKGQLVQCDRCKKQVFLLLIGTKATDGSYTYWDVFEHLPEGWDYVTKVGDLCPACSEEWKKRTAAFMKEKRLVSQDSETS